MHDSISSTVTLKTFGRNVTQLQNLVISLQIHAFEGYFLLNFFIKRWRWQKSLLQMCDCSAIPFVIAFGYTTNFLFSIFPKVVLDYLHNSQGRRKVELGEKNSGYGCNIYYASWQRRQYFGRIGFIFDTEEDGLRAKCKHDVHTCAAFFSSRISQLPQNQFDMKMISPRSSLPTKRSCCRWFLQSSGATTNYSQTATCQLAAHSGLGSLPAPPKKPKKKAR